MAKSSPIPEQIEVAELLAGKAAGDLLVTQKLAHDPEVRRPSWLPCPAAG